MAVNVALYGDAGHRWAMTERGRDALDRGPSHLAIGPSTLRWEGGTLIIDIDEIGVPIPTRIRGQVRVHPAATVAQSFHLDRDGLHTWRPIAPIARVEADFREPNLSWRGHGYFDWNSGTVPLEQSFASWDWSRAATRDGAAIFYDVARNDGVEASLAIKVDRTGAVQPVEPPARCSLAASPVWRIARGTRSDAGRGGAIVKTLEDTPFYARSIVAADIEGEPVMAMHESLSLNRFVSPIVQLMLPFRMPRRARWNSARKAT